MNERRMGEERRNFQTGPYSLAGAQTKGSRAVVSLLHSAWFHEVITAVSVLEHTAFAALSCQKKSVSKSRVETRGEKWIAKRGEKKGNGGGESPQSRD